MRVSFIVGALLMVSSLGWSLDPVSIVGRDAVSIAKGVYEVPSPTGAHMVVCVGKEGVEWSIERLSARLDRIDRSRSDSLDEISALTTEIARLSRSLASVVSIDDPEPKGKGLCTPGSVTHFTQVFMSTPYGGIEGSTADAEFDNGFCANATGDGYVMAFAYGAATGTDVHTDDSDGYQSDFYITKVATKYGDGCVFAYSRIFYSLDGQDPRVAVISSRDYPDGCFDNF